MSDLQNFVNVALATAVGGEGDFANDKLSNLRTVGTGFGSLIYNLKETTGFWELSQRCNSVWTALRDNKRLPKMLVSLLTKVHLLFKAVACTGEVGCGCLTQPSCSLCFSSG